MRSGFSRHRSINFHSSVNLPAPSPHLYGTPQSLDDYFQSNDSHSFLVLSPLELVKRAIEFVLFALVKKAFRHAVSASGGVFSASVFIIVSLLILLWQPLQNPKGNLGWRDLDRGRA